MASGSTTPTPAATAGRSTNDPRIRVGASVLVRLDSDLTRPGVIIHLEETPAWAGGLKVSIRVFSHPLDYLAEAVRENRDGVFQLSATRENLWCIGAPHGPGIGCWELA